MGKPVFFANELEFVEAIFGVQKASLMKEKSRQHVTLASLRHLSVKLGPGTGGRGREAALTSQSQKLTTSVIRPWLMVLYVHKNLVWFIRDERPQKLSDKVSGTDGKLT